jgi:hypothetical protein
VASPLSDRELLVEALAVHLGMVARGDMDRAVSSREADEPAEAPGRLLAEVLVERGLVKVDRLGTLEVLADDLLARHGGDMRQCLDGLSAFGRLRRELGLDRQLAALESRHPTSAPAPPRNGAAGHEPPAAAAFAPGFPRLDSRG